MKQVVFDIECEKLHEPQHIWCIVCYDIDTQETKVFRKVTEDEAEKQEFLRYADGVDRWIGHNILGFDYPVLNRLLSFEVRDVGQNTLDTLIVSKLVDYSRQGHSLEDYGIEFNVPKSKFVDFSKYSHELELRCIDDVKINTLVYTKYLKYINNKERQPSIAMEHEFQYYVVNKLSSNGFSFNKDKAEALLKKITEELKVLDDAILISFPPKLKLIREVTPKETKYGTISLSSIPKALRSDIHSFSAGAPFCYCAWHDFNPSSHKQIVHVLGEAGWRPSDRTKTHIETERELTKLKYTKRRTKELDLRISLLHTKLEELKRTGWKVNETNLETLPPKAPASARSLAKRIMLESRRRTLTEWLGLSIVEGRDCRIHGKFYGIGAWTHRMAHQNPNTANIPNEFDTGGKKKLYGKELRSLWRAPKNRLLLGVDAEGIQLRIFAHYIDDPEFTEALVKGKKEDKSDPHSLNQSILGGVCKTRQAAKRFIYALLLGAGSGKLTEILECSSEAADEALQRLLGRYTGFAYLKEKVIPADAKRGWFVGLDGRAVGIPSDTVGGRKHLCMSGYLQNGEVVVMKMASLKWCRQLPEFNSSLVGMIHDEWQTETPNDVTQALRLAEVQSSSLREVGEELQLKCPLAGSYWNDDHKDYTIGTNWSVTH